MRAAGPSFLRHIASISSSLVLKVPVETCTSIARPMSPSTGISAQVTHHAPFALQQQRVQPADRTVFSRHFSHANVFVSGDAWPGMEFYQYFAISTSFQCSGPGCLTSYGGTLPRAYTFGGAKAMQVLDKMVCFGFNRNPFSRRRFSTSMRLPPATPRLFNRSCRQSSAQLTLAP